MQFELTPQQESERVAFHEFAQREIAPLAAQFDREQRVCPRLVERMAQRGYLGALLSRDFGGSGLDYVSYGHLQAEVARACASVQTLLTVHGMVAAAVQRWGSRAQKSTWLPRLASGDVRASFALSEPNVGSDAHQVETTARRVNGAFLLSGEKKWISHGQTANLFLVFAQLDGRPCAFLVERDSPGLRVEPIQNMLGSRGSMLALLRLQDCEIPEHCMLGREGMGFSHVAATALDHGRYCVAWGSLGIAQACLDASREYASSRKQFGALLNQHALVQQLLTRMIVNVKAATLLCYEAGWGKDTGSPDAIVATMIAKYFASTTAMQAALDAVQLHGANGISGDYPVERYLRDAKVMEIIEGSTQILEIAIAKYDNPAPQAVGAGAQ